MSIAISSILVDHNNQAVACAITTNAFRTVKGIRSYFVRVVIRSVDDETPGIDRIDRSDIWAKGNDKMRIDVEISGLEKL